jgi:hypothetical protein
MGSAVWKSPPKRELGRGTLESKNERDSLDRPSSFKSRPRPEQSIYGVISNTTPWPLPPPMAVVPKRLPALSLIRP